MPRNTGREAGSLLYNSPPLAFIFQPITMIFYTFGNKILHISKILPNFTHIMI